MIHQKDKNIGKNGKKNMDIKRKLEYWHPNLIENPYIIIKIFDTDDENDKFNCVSYSLDVYDKWIWTNEPSWPIDIPRNLKIDSFKLLYNKYGYVECNNGDYEVGFDKIAFYIKNNNPSHASKQYGNMWRSKIGSVILEHQLEWISGNDGDNYGYVEFIMKRKKD